MNTSDALLQKDDVIGRYRIERCLGRGGMGEVYLAYDQTGGIPVAIKLLLPDIMARDPAFVERFQEEGRLACRISHPNVVGVIDARRDTDAGFCYLVMEYIDGGSLQNLLDQSGRLDWEWAMNIALKVSSALELAADLGIVHRDIKPDNIMLTNSGEVKLADLGIARRVERGAEDATGKVMVGTPGYASPEQCIDPARVDARSDIYSLGATLYETLTGKTAYPCENPIATISHVLHDPVPDPRSVNIDIPAPVAQLVMRMMSREQSARPQSAAELSAELNQLLAAGRSTGRGRDPVAFVRGLYFDLERRFYRLFPQRSDRRRGMIALILAAVWFVLLVMPLPPPPEAKVTGEDPNPALLREADRAIAVLRPLNASLAREILELEGAAAVPASAALRDTLFLRQDPVALQRWFDCGARFAGSDLSAEWLAADHSAAALPDRDYIARAGRLLDRFGNVCSPDDFGRLLRSAVIGGSAQRNFALNALDILFGSATNRAVLQQPFDQCAGLVAEIPAEDAVLLAGRLNDFERLLKLLREAGFVPTESSRNSGGSGPFREMLRTQ